MWGKELTRVSQNASWRGSMFEFCAKTRLVCQKGNGCGESIYTEEMARAKGKEVEKVQVCPQNSTRHMKLVWIVRNETGKLDTVQSLVYLECQKRVPDFILYTTSTQIFELIPLPHSPHPLPLCPSLRLSASVSCFLPFLPLFPTTYNPSSIWPPPFPLAQSPLASSLILLSRYGSAIKCLTPFCPLSPCFLPETLGSVPGAHAFLALTHGFL